MGCSSSHIPSDPRQLEGPDAKQLVLPRTQSCSPRRQRHQDKNSGPIPVADRLTESDLESELAIASIPLDAVAPMDRDNSSRRPTVVSQPSTGNTPRTVPSTSQSLQSHPASAAAQSSSASTPNPQRSKRSRHSGAVTPTACTECRKKRTKCDGQKPCGRCKSQKGVECVYEVPLRHSKENLRNQIEGLQQRQRSSDLVFAALVRPDLWKEILGQLRNGQTVENISKWLGGTLPLGGGGLTAVAPRGDHDASIGDASAPACADGASRAALSPLGLGPENASTVATQQSALRSDLGQSNPWHSSTHSQTSSTRSNRQAKAMSSAKSRRALSQSRIASWAESMQTDHMPNGLPRSHGLDQVLFTSDKPELKHSTGTWTTITNDINLILHLLALYFCWEYPTFASLSKEHFLRDFRDGRHRYCSPLLVNALLALGCRFSTHPMTRANSKDSHSAGDHFFKESQRLFDQETDHHSLTTIQALGIMSIREASCGRASEGRYYVEQSVRLAFEMGLHRTQDDGDKDELDVQLATFWGAFSLDNAYSLATGSLPNCSCLPHLPSKPLIIGDIEASLWIPYTDDGAPLQLPCEQPSNERSVYKCFCELSELAHQSLYLMHSPGKPLTARDLLSIYTEYLNWYDRIPEALRLGHNFTPAVLFAHMYYHFAILLLFRPLLKLRIIESEVSPRDVCLQAANAMQGFLTSYSRLYTLKRVPSFVPYFALTSSIMHLAIMATTVLTNESDMALRSDPNVSEAVKQGIASLAEMTPYHHIAEQAPYILRYLAKKWNIDVDIDTGAALNPEEYERLVGNLDLFASTMVAEDFVLDLGAGKDVEERTSRQVGKAAESMKDPLFWPFPMQGRPMLSKGKELGEAGFAVL